MKLFWHAIGLPLACLLALAVSRPLAAQDQKPEPNQEEKKGEQPQKGAAQKVTGKLQAHTFKMHKGRFYRVTVKSESFEPNVLILDGDRVVASQLNQGFPGFPGFPGGPLPPGALPPFPGGGLQPVPAPGIQPVPLPPVQAVPPAQDVAPPAVQPAPLPPGAAQVVAQPAIQPLPPQPALQPFQPPGGAGKGTIHLSFTPSKTGDYRVLVSVVPHSQVVKAALDYSIEVVEQKADLSVSDQITNADPNYPGRQGSHHKLFKVKLEANKTYQIDMVSTDFDAYLFLEDAKGAMLTHDDDSGGNLNARIVYRPTKTDTYRVIATTFGQGATGKFTLTVVENPNAQQNPNFGVFPPPGGVRPPINIKPIRRVPVDPPVQVDPVPPGVDINFNVDRVREVNVPGVVNPADPIGIPATPAPKK